MHFPSTFDHVMVKMISRRSMTVLPDLATIVLDII